MFSNSFTLSARGKVPVVGTEGVPSYMCSGGVAALLNWEGSWFAGGVDGMEVLKMLLADPAKTGVNPEASWRARRNVLAQTCWKNDVFSSVERNEMVIFSNTSYCILFKIICISDINSVPGLARVGCARLHPHGENGGVGSDSE